MRAISTSLLALMLALYSPGTAQTSEPMSSSAYQVPPTRAFDLRLAVDRSPEDVIRDWTTESTLDRFMGVSSDVQPRVGGAYEIRFRPGDDARARANSTLGARILALDDGRHLAFEWRVPPWAAEPVRSAPPTRVDVRVSAGRSHPGAAGRTIIHLRHSGFGAGEAWDPVHDFFQWSWLDILSRYKRLTEAGEP